MQKLRITTDRHGIDLVSDRGHVAHMTAGYGHTQEQDAADILRAVNCHADLLAALELANALLDNSDVRHYIGHELGEMSQLHTALNAARAAIAKAKGGA